MISPCFWIFIVSVFLRVGNRSLVKEPAIDSKKYQ